MKIELFKVKRGKGYLFFYRSLQFIVSIILKPLLRIEIINKEKSFYNGKIILCCNHISALDPILIAGYYPRPVYFLAKKELFKNFFFRMLIEFFNAFPINRSGVDRSAINKAIEVVNNGNPLVIFPEGTRSSGKEIGEGHKGLALISYMSDTPILPIAICDMKKVSRGKKKILWPKIKIIFGDLIDANGIFKNHSKKEGIALIANISMENLKKLYKEISC